MGHGGQIRLKMDGSRDVQLDPREHSHSDHCYAMTSHSFQEGSMMLKRSRKVYQLRRSMSSIF